VLVGADGRARVLDFGLASRRDRAPAAATAGTRLHGHVQEDTPSASSSSLLASFNARSGGRSDLSRDGAIVGTPAYMSPEQHLGLDVDARSDVFSFCVALWEALHGAHPYAAATLGELVFAITRGDLRPGAARRRIPRWLHRLLLRGLDPDPARRLADARALVDALTRGLRQRRRLVTAAAFALTAAAALALTFTLVRAAPQIRPCQGVESRLIGVWDDARQQRLREAIYASGDANAVTTWERASDHIGDLTRAWVVMQRDACEATHLRGEQSQALMDLRVTCLRRHLNELSALIDLLIEADPAVIARTITALQGLPPLDRCADVQALQSPIPPPADPRARRRLDALDQRLAVVHANLGAGRFADGLARAEAIAADAAELAHRPLDAEIALRRGQLLDRSGAHVAAEEALRDAVFLAVGARHDVIAAEAMTELIYHLGLRRARPEEGLEWSRHAEAAIARLAPGREREHLEAKRLDREGLVRTAAGDLVGGRALQERALAQMIAVRGPDDLQSAALRINLSATLADLGEPALALDHLRAAAEVFARELGADHLHLAAIHNNLGTLLDGQADYLGALEHHRRALAIKQRGLGPDNPALANSHNNLGGTLIHLHRLDEAERHLELALAIKAAAYGPDAPQLIETRGLLADLRLERGEHERALADARDAIDRARAAHGDDHPSHIALLAVAGDAAAALGRPSEARGLLDRALTLARAHGAEASVRGRVERSLAALAALP
jgi:tetratricopeptide (TPR) repeat protein